MSMIGPTIENLALYTPDDGLKVLRPKHLQIVNLFMAGLPRQEIADVMGCTPQTITNTINDPAVKAVWQAEMQQALLELDSLFPLAVAAVRENLQQGSRKEKLRAAQDIFKVRGLYKETVAKADTAEDVMQRIRDVYNNVQVNNIQINHQGNAVAEPRAAVGAAQR